MRNSNTFVSRCSLRMLSRLQAIHGLELSGVGASLYVHDTSLLSLGLRVVALAAEPCFTAAKTVDNVLPGIVRVGLSRCGGGDGGQ